MKHFTAFIIGCLKTGWIWPTLAHPLTTAPYVIFVKKNKYFTLRNKSFGVELLLLQHDLKLSNLADIN